jgi:hypothetical protein
MRSRRQRAVPTPTPKVDMAGRWMLSAPDKPACGMKFEGAPGEKQGAIEPEGGCPGKLFKTRHWQLAQGQLTINDHENGPLERLKLVGGYFQGQSTPACRSLSSAKSLHPTGLPWPNISSIASPSPATPIAPR